jgi:hypothetical protein
MSLADLTLDLWRTFDEATARRIAQDAADHVGGRVSLVEATEHLVLDSPFGGYSCW